jgi:predicted nucleotidyltransferase
VKKGVLAPSALGSIEGGVIAFVQRVAKLWDHHLGERLAGVYLIGSLAHGGYSARYSDIDIALIVDDALSSGEIDAVNAKVAAYSAELAARYSLFWADAEFSAGRFPPLDRVDYLDHAVPLLERRHLEPERPSLTEIRAYLREAPLRHWSQQVIQLSALAVLGVADHKRYLRALLYPARFVFSWETGNIASNDTAVAYVGSRGLLGPDIDIVARALRCRNDGSDPGDLFSERLRLPRLLEICTTVSGQS